MNSFQILEADTETITAEEINYEHQMFVDSLRTGFQHAIKCGELLTEKKKRLDHGDFIPWVIENCRFSHRMAERYMRLYEKYKQNATRVSHFDTQLSIRAALELLKETDEKPEKEPESEGAFTWAKEPSIVAMQEGWKATDKAIQLLKHADRDPEMAAYYLTMLTEKVRRLAVELGLL